MAHMQLVYSNITKLHVFLHPFYPSHPSPRGSASQFKKYKNKYLEKKKKPRTALVAYGLAFHPGVRESALICKSKHMSL